jgi:hypothetical protein
MKNQKTKAKNPKRQRRLSASAGSVIPFVNNKGHVMRIPGHLTIGDLVKKGMVKIKLMPNGTPIPDGWWQDAYSPNAKLTHSRD